VVIVVAILLSLAFFVIPHVVVREITNYEPYTFSSVLDYDSMREDYGIYENNNPSDYGFQTVENIDFKSFYDNTQLNGWYIPSKQASDQCIIFVHGRTSNRLKAMKYLALIDSLDLDNNYNIFIPDLRNSGKSAPAKTYMGYKFAEDPLGAISIMHLNKGQNGIVLYGFSMGGMAIQELIGNSRLKNELDKKNIKINRIILDSPLSNVKETLWISSKEMKLPRFIFNRAWKIFNIELNGEGDNLRLSHLLKTTTIPILIIQSHDDHTTLSVVLDNELENLGEKDNVKVVYFSGTEHVRTFQNPAKMHKYIEAVRDFFSNS
jgi:pimeloyl-ACP methyl ester carboxylesterase